jgi:uncharacterized membrane protein (DUF373 family)
VKRFELVVVAVLMGLLLLIVAISTVELGWLLLRDVSTIRTLVLDVDEMLDLFGFFLLVLIGLELVTTLKLYFRKGMIQVEFVIEVALIGVAQKVIILDTSRSGGLSLLGLAALILALAAAFHLVRSARHQSERMAKPRRRLTRPRASKSAPGAHGGGQE